MLYFAKTQKHRLPSKCVFENCDLDNSLVAEAVFVTGKIDNDSAARVTLDRTWLLCPERLQYGYLSFGGIKTFDRISITANSTLFHPPAHLLQRSEQTSWSGNDNVFSVPGTYNYGSRPLNFSDHRTQWQSDQNSLELAPLEFLPTQWRIDRAESPGYKPKPNGSDYGVDVDRLQKVLQSEPANEPRTIP